MNEVLPQYSNLILHGYIFSCWDRDNRCIYAQENHI